MGGSWGPGVWDFLQSILSRGAWTWVAELWVGLALGWAFLGAPRGRWWRRVERRGARPRAAVSGVEREAVSWSCTWSGHAALERELRPPRALQRPRTGEGPESRTPSYSGVMGRQGRERHRFLRLRLAEGLHSVRCEHPVRAAGPLGVLGASPVQGPLRVPESGLSSSSAPSAVTCSSALEEDRRRGGGARVGGWVSCHLCRSSGAEAARPPASGSAPHWAGGCWKGRHQRRGALGLPRTRAGQPWGGHGHTVTSPSS